jgi:hypothetical protein
MISARTAQSAALVAAPGCCGQLTNPWTSPDDAMPSTSSLGGACPPIAHLPTAERRRRFFVSFFCFRARRFAPSPLQESASRGAPLPSLWMQGPDGATVNCPTWGSGGAAEPPRGGSGRAAELHTPAAPVLVGLRQVVASRPDARGWQRGRSGCDASARLATDRPISQPTATPAASDHDSLGHPPAEPRTSLGGRVCAHAASGALTSGLVQRFHQVAGSSRRGDRGDGEMGGWGDWGILHGAVSHSWQHSSRRSGALAQTDLTRPYLPISLSPPLPIAPIGPVSSMETLH